MAPSRTPHSKSVLRAEALAEDAQSGHLAGCAQNHTSVTPYRTQPRK